MGWRRGTSRLHLGHGLFVLAITLCAPPTRATFVSPSFAPAFQALPELHAQGGDDGGELLVHEASPERALEGGERLAAPPSHAPVLTRPRRGTRWLAAALPEAPRRRLGARPIRAPPS